MGLHPDRRRLIVGFCHRVAYAALISALVWILAGLPGGVDSPRAVLLIVMDWPIAVATQPLPCKEFAIDLWFTVQGGEPCPTGIGFQVPVPEMFFNHMRVGIPVYVFIFYLPNFILFLFRWSRRRRAAEKAA